MDSILQAGVVSAPLQVLTDRLASLTVREISLILTPDAEVRKLQRTLERIRAIVAHVEENRSILSNNISNEAWKLWLQDVEELSCSADDLLDGILLDVAKHRAKLSADADGEKRVRSMLLSSLKLTVPHEISRIRQELEEIAKEMEALFINDLTKLGSNRISKSSYCRARSSLVEEGSVFGREWEKNDIVGIILAEDRGGSNVSVIPIVGLGGIGKTTLAQVVYGDNRLTSKFDLRMWVSVSMDFNTISITKSIIESATGERCKLSDLDPVQIKLRDLILGKRFLLVLDDYWSEEYEDWDLLFSPFKVGSGGSKIIVTTRSMIVSRILGTVPPYCLKTLSNEHCWELMKQRAFSNGTLEYNLQLEEIGKMIAEKCKGLPLAAKTLGGMLRFKNDPAEWSSILKSEIWDLPRDKNDIFPALTLSYYHLPAHLKNCFTYCSIFPQNYDFEMNELSLLWIAQGFVNASGKKQLEEFGNDYFKDLLWRSFFQLSHENARGQKIYKMHDLIHGMAKLVSGHTCYHQEDNHSIEEYPFFKNTRHFSFHCNNVDPIMLEGSLWYKNLRTFRVISKNVGKIQVSYDLFLKLKSLRVLDFSRMGLDELPDSIDHLKHLRYLNLSENHFNKLPESVTNLFGLQTLKLEQCNKLLELPSNMKNMVGLRHLHFDLKLLSCMPPEFGKLVNLQSLSTFIVGRSKGRGIGELKNMRFLRGCICIKNLENVSNSDEAKEAMLHMKPFINKLELEWSEFRSKFNDEEILAGLHPHDDLQELLMTNYAGNLLPGWFGSPSCTLSRVHLRDFKSYHTHILASLGKLKHLKSLVIESMSNCSSIDLEASTFLSLESLKMEDMPNLTSWSGFHCSSFPCLRILDISDCPELTNLPSLANATLLQHLTISRCPKILSLPDDGLPVSLQALMISESDIIANRCRIEEGEDWYKISFIRMVEIDGVEIPQDMRRF
ncbi:Apoptotic ATPase [Handroanthus impetiginosus]|uniref:Apoptotic ATPase n=1 Tax=Handroanthus impetiginosus TaxID=429701 RepID=A0A2G9H434_9LAMI|nr:Apoptotic ATPase [Handroanthus impetiginosus]